MLHFKLSQLEYILALDRHRNFVKAAESCLVTQPTLSMQLRKLENQIGIVIFDRTRQPVIPTELGRKVIDQARSVITEARKIEALSNEMNNAISGELKVGVIPTLAPYVIPRIIRGVGKKFPQIKIHFYEMITSQIVQKIKAEELDCGLLVTPLEEKEIKETPIYYEEIFAYLPQSSTYSNKISLDIGELQKEHIWVLSEGHCFRDQSLSICNSKDSDSGGRFEFEIGSLETLIKIVDQEGGITFIPELAKRDLELSVRGNFLQIGKNKPSREVSVITSMNPTKKKLIKLLSEISKEELPGEMRDRTNREVIKWKR